MTKIWDLTTATSNAAQNHAASMAATVKTVGIIGGLVSRCRMWGRVIVLSEVVLVVATLAVNMP